MSSLSARLSLIFSSLGHSYTHLIMMLWPTVVLVLEKQWSMGYAELLPLAVTKLLAPLLIGRDSADVEALWQELYQEVLLQGRAGVVMRALSILDTALWDLNASLRLSREMEDWQRAEKVLLGWLEEAGIKRIEKPQRRLFW